MEFRFIARADRFLTKSSDQRNESRIFEFISIRELEKIILSKIRFEYVFFFFFFFFRFNYDFAKEIVRGEKNMSLLSSKRIDRGSILLREVVYSIYSHDYSRALYFADRATLSIDFFRYGNWDSGVDLTVLGSPCPFFHDPIVHGRGR